MTTKSSRMMNKLWNATEAIPECFSIVLNTLNSFNLSSSINYEAEDTHEYSDEEENNDYNNEEENYNEDNDYEDDYNNYPEPEPDIVREVHFTLKKMSDGSLRLVMDFSDENQSISLDAITKHREIIKLDSSGIQPSTIDNGWD